MEGENLFPFNAEQPNWHVLFVRSNQEKRIAERLGGKGVEHYLPCTRPVRQWKDRRVRLQVPLFPGYIFVRLPFPERMKVLTLPYVVSMLGSKNSPSVVSEEEIAVIRRGIEHGDAEPHEYLKTGQRVLITGGVMSGMEGILVRKQTGSRVVISIDSIFRAFAVELDQAFVSPLAPASTPEFQSAPRALSTDVI